METVRPNEQGGADLERAYATALAEWRAWDHRASEAQRCDVAVAAQRSLEALRALEVLRNRGSGAG